MSKRPSLVHQAMKVLEQGAAFGQKRHADKENAKNKGLQYDSYTKSKMYSYNTFEHTKDTTMSYIRFCKEEFGCRYLEEIKPEYFSKFIERGKVNGGAYEKDTAGTYRSRIQKFEEIYNKISGDNKKFVDDTYKDHTIEKFQDRIRMDRQIHDRIIEKAYKNKADNGRALDIDRNLGLRASEGANLRMQDFKFDKEGDLDSIHIHKSKGGRNRDIAVREIENDMKPKWSINTNKGLTKEQYERVYNIYNYYKRQGLRPEDKLFPNKKESYEKAFNRYREKVLDEMRKDRDKYNDIDLDKDYNGCGIHSMRKEFAQDYYDRETERRIDERGQDHLKEIEKEVKQELTEILGHNRIEVLNSYLD